MSEAFAGEPLDPYAMKEENARLRAELSLARKNEKLWRERSIALAKDCDNANANVAKLRKVLVKAKGALYYLPAMDADQSLWKQGAIAAIDAVLSETKGDTE